MKDDKSEIFAPKHSRVKGKEKKVKEKEGEKARRGKGKKETNKEEKIFAPFLCFVLLFFHIYIYIYIYNEAVPFTLITLTAV